jgi:hypothetical protein
MRFGEGDTLEQLRSCWVAGRVEAFTHAGRPASIMILVAGWLG